MRRTFFIATATALAILLSASLAVAHTRTFGTNLTVNRKPSGAVEAGTKVKILGQLNSKKAACIKQSQIKLIEVGEGQIAADRTGSRGKYSFRVRVQETTRFRVKFAGKNLNVTHPHTHVCEPSKASIRVRVR